MHTHIQTIHTVYNHHYYYSQFLILLYMEYMH